MKQKKMLLILLCVLIVLVLGILFLLKEDKPNPTNLQNDAETEERLVVFTAKQEDIQSVTYTHPEEQFTLELTDGIWLIKEQPKLSVSQPRADGVAYDMAEFIAREVVEEDAENIEKYGLLPAQITTTLTFKNGKEVPFYVGAKVQGEEQYYVKIGESNTVYAVDVSQCESITYTMQDLMAMTMLELSQSEIASVEVTQKDGAHFCVTKSAEDGFEQWFFTEPFSWGVDETVIEQKLLTFLYRIDAFSYVIDKTDAELGLANPQATVKAKLTDGTERTVQVGNVDAETGNVAVKVDGISYPGIVDLQIIQLTKLTKFDIIDKTVEIADYNDIYKVELEGEVEATLVYSDPCSLNGKSASKETAIKLYSDICELKIDAENGSVSGAPVMTVTHTYKNGNTKSYKIYQQDAFNYVVTADDKAYFVIFRDAFMAWKKQIEAYL